MVWIHVPVFCIECKGQWYGLPLNLLLSKPEAAPCLTSSVVAMVTPVRFVPSGGSSPTSSLLPGWRQVANSTCLFRPHGPCSWQPEIDSESLIDGLWQWRPSTCLVLSREDGYQAGDACPSINHFYGMNYILHSPQSSKQPRLIQHQCGCGEILRPSPYRGQMQDDRILLYTLSIF